MRSRRLLRASLLAALAAACASLLLAAGASAAVITKVTFSGSSAAPTLTITGSGFGTKPPKAFSAAKTSCGEYGPENGDWYGKQTAKKDLWFQDDTNGWLAGAGKGTSGTCIGIVAESWSATQAVLHFGVSYGTFGSWDADSGDNYVLGLDGYFWGGVVSY